MKAQIPNLITLLNLVSGCMAIVQVHEQSIQLVFYLGLCCLALDFLDGFVARILNVQSEIGAQLDSLADVVSFGVLPSFMMYSLLQPVDSKLAYCAFILVAFASYRLAKFNVSNDNSDTFSGLPVPAMMMAVMGLYMSFESFDHLSSQWVIFILLFSITILSLLMITSIKLLSIKSIAKGQLNSYQIILLGSFVCAFLIFGAIGLTIGIGMYIILSLVKFEIFKKQ